MQYSAEEKETTCVYDYVDNTWIVYSCVPRHMTKLRKIAEPTWEEKDGERVIAAKWKLNGNQVRFAIGTVTEMSEANKAAARARIQQLHAKRESTV